MAIRAGLDRTAVIAAALDLLDEVGLEELTLRKLADRLGVKAPAIYWHVRNKQELLDEMATTMLRAALPVPERPVHEYDWPELLAANAHGMRRALGSRRDGGKLFGGSYLTDTRLLAGTEPVLERLTECGFTLRAATQLSRTVFFFVLGFVIEQQGTLGREDLFDPVVRQQRTDTEHYPLSAAAGQHMFADFDALFDAGVRVIAAGAAVLREAQNQRGG